MGLCGVHSDAEGLVKVICSAEDIAVAPPFVVPHAPYEKNQGPPLSPPITQFPFTRTSLLLVVPSTVHETETLLICGAQVGELLARPYMQTVSPTLMLVIGS